MVQNRKSPLGIGSVIILCLVFFSLFSIYFINQHTSHALFIPFTIMQFTNISTSPTTTSVVTAPTVTSSKTKDEREEVKIISSPENSIISSSPPLHFNKQPTTKTLPTEKTNVPPSNPKLHAVTYASHGGRDDRFCRAVESAIRHDISLIILGWGIKWTGLSQKLEAAMRYASEIPPNDIIMFTDAFDVMFTNKPSHILEEYLNLNGDIIFAGECGCWPHVMIDHGKPCFDSYPPSPTPYRYLNSGTWIAHAKSAVEMLKAVILEAGNDFTNANDQKLVADMFISSRYNIQLDYYAKLFQSMHMTFDRPLAYCNPYEDIQVINGQFYNKRTKSYPSVFHFNGGGKSHHLKMESQLWYKQSKYQTNEEKLKLSTTKISIPLPENKNRTIEFHNLCPGYI